MSAANSGSDLFPFKILIYTLCALNNKYILPQWRVLIINSEVYFHSVTMRTAVIQGFDLTMQLITVRFLDAVNRSGETL